MSVLKIQSCDPITGPMALWKKCFMRIPSGLEDLKFRYTHSYFYKEKHKAKARNIDRIILYLYLGRTTNISKPKLTHRDILLG